MKIRFFLLFSVLSTGVFAQEFLGISQSRYAGIQGVYANPAFSTLNQMKREIGSLGYEFAFSNNFMGINGTLLNDLRSLTIYTVLSEIPTPTTIILPPHLGNRTSS